MNAGGLVATRAVVICCGSGGVGKTTVAAALGIAGAAAGRRVCVVTIDPARRLADTLGMDLEHGAGRIAGAWPGTLDAVMLDARRTFDDLVRHYAADADQAERILANPLYRNLTSALSGTQEYMATEKLFELRESGAYDLIVVDTPPTRHALDFLEAPQRLSNFLDNRIFRLLLTPGRSYLKAVSAASRLLLRTIGKVAGSEIVEDTITFFQAFEGMEQGFRDRADAVDRLLRDEATAFVVVASPRRETTDDALHFIERLAKMKQSPELLVVNRVHPDFGDPSAILAAGTRPDTALGELVTNARELSFVAHREATLVSELAEKAALTELVTIPLLGGDVHDLDGLGIVVRHLVPGSLP